MKRADIEKLYSALRKYTKKGFRKRIADKVGFTPDFVGLVLTGKRENEAVVMSAMVVLEELRAEEKEDQEAKAAREDEISKKLEELLLF